MAATYDPIATQTLSTAASTVTFSSIPSTYTDLVLVINARGTTAAISTSVYFTTNITGSNYSSIWLVGNGSAAASSRYSNSGQGYLGYISAASNNASSRGNIIAHFMNYSNTATNKTVLSRGDVAEAESAVYVNLIRGTSALSTITVGEGGGNNFVAGSTFNLYGIAAAGASAKATGGNIITTDGTYWYHAFTASGTFTPSATLSCDVLVVAGGASGSAEIGAGGGAGGVLEYLAQSIPASAQTITIGAGGASRTAASPGQGNNGTNSSFASLTASVGGGGGGVANSSAGSAGGSGGGGGANQSGGPYAGGAATSGQGNAGGTGGYSTQGGLNYWTAGGGGGKGGAGGVGGGVNFYTGGAGGAGSNTWSTWFTTNGLGVSGFIAGGGGGIGMQQYGGGSNAPVAGPAGSGGGGIGAMANAYGGTSSLAGNGTVNTGGGGGGGGWAQVAGGTATAVSGQGGSGLVIVRYAV